MAGTRNPSLAQLYGRIGGLRTRARHDPGQYTSAARRAFLQSFELEVDPEGTLAPDERARRAEAAKKAHFAELAYRSAVARGKNKREKRPSPPAQEPSVLAEARGGHR
jgi:hypothetical protein